MASIKEHEKDININEDYLQILLRKKENDPSLVVTNCNVKNGISKGQGYLSNMLRIEASVMRKGQMDKEHIIVKMLPTDVTSESFVAELSAFPNELRAFSETLPQVSELLQSAEKPSEIGAKFYYCKNTAPYVLIVEDLTAKGFKMADRRKGIDLKHCLLVMKTLGRYHAATTVLHELNPESIERYNVNFWCEDGTDEFFENHFLHGLDSAAEVADRLYPNGKCYGDRLRKRAKTIRKDTKDLFNLNKNNFNVLLHGDLWLNNLMFRYNETSGEVQDVRFVDFQLSCYASAGIDFQYFMHSSPTEDVRINHMDDLFKAYHSELHETLELLGYEHKSISYEQLRAEYSRNILFGFKTAITILPIFLADKNDDFDIASVVENRNVEGGYRKRASNPLFIPVLKRLLPQFDKMGVF